MRRLRYILVFGLLVSLLGYITPPAAVAAPGDVTAQASTCDPGTVWGLCFDTLPALYCCSGAALGWSQIVVGDRFPVSGRVNMNPPGQRMQLRFPSGKVIPIPLDEKGAFNQTIGFDEEGVYRLESIMPDGTVMTDRAVFSVAYQATPLNVPLVQAIFGAQHPTRSRVTMALPANQTFAVQLQFTDAQGNPVRDQDLTFHWSQPLHTNHDGIATVTLDTTSQSVSYQESTVYPGLAVLTYREARVDNDGHLHGLPGGDIAGTLVGNQWYFPLREFFSKADPDDSAMTLLTWHGDTQTVEMPNALLLVASGQVLFTPARLTGFRAHPLLKDGRLYLSLSDLAQLFDRWQYAAISGDAVRVSVPFNP